MKKRKGKIRFYTIKAVSIKFAILILLCMCLLSSSFGGRETLAGVFFFKTNRKIPIYCVENINKEIAISFDAAWGSDKTEKILQILKDENVTATFFLVGMWVDKNEDLTKKIFDSGCEIGTHSNSHPDFTNLSDSQRTLELGESVRKIENITNKKVTLFRCPFGAYNNATLSIAEDLKLQTIQWDVDSLDWKGISSETIVKNVITKVSSGSIILCHNNADHIVEALPTILTNLKSRGYTFKNISDLLLKSNYKIDATGRQISA